MQRAVCTLASKSPSEELREDYAPMRFCNERFWSVAIKRLLPGGIDMVVSIGAPAWARKYPLPVPYHTWSSLGLQLTWFDKLWI